jgi:hypothetical protein
MVRSLCIISHPVTRFTPVLVPMNHGRLHYQIMDNKKRANLKLPPPQQRQQQTRGLIPEGFALLNVGNQLRRDSDCAGMP